jgi:hypothetical protein
MEAQLCETWLAAGERMAATKFLLELLVEGGMPLRTPEL